MQECFRLHPDIYGSELDEDEVDEQLKEHIGAADSSPETTLETPTPADSDASPAEPKGSQAALQRTTPDQSRTKIEAKSKSEEQPNPTAPQSLTGQTTSRG